MVDGGGSGLDLRETDEFLGGLFLAAVACFTEEGGGSAEEGFVDRKILLLRADEHCDEVVRVFVGSVGVVSTGMVTMERWSRTSRRCRLRERPFWQLVCRCCKFVVQEREGDEKASRRQLRAARSDDTCDSM